MPLSKLVLANRLELKKHKTIRASGEALFSIDFVIDGQSLHEALRAGQDIGCLWADPRRWDSVVAGQLLGDEPAPIHGVRVALFVCLECGDLGCGAHTVRVSRAGDELVWDEFGWENDYDPKMSEFDRYREIGPFRFDARRVREAMQQWRSNPEAP